MTARESPTFATYKWSPTKTAVDAVDPSSLKVFLSESKKLESVVRYVSAASQKERMREAYDKYINVVVSPSIHMHNEEKRFDLTCMLTYCRFGVFHEFWMFNQIVE